MAWLVFYPSLMLLGLNIHELCVNTMYWLLLGVHNGHAFFCHIQSLLLASVCDFQVDDTLDSLQLVWIKSLAFIHSFGFWWQVSVIWSRPTFHLSSFSVTSPWPSLEDRSSFTQLTWRLPLPASIEIGMFFTLCKVALLLHFKSIPL